MIPFYDSFFCNSQILILIYLTTDYTPARPFRRGFKTSQITLIERTQKLWPSPPAKPRRAGVQ